MAREFFKENGELESTRDKKFRMEIEKTSRKTTEVHTIPEAAKFYAEYLQRFPFDWLNDFFRYYNNQTMAGEFKALIDGPEDIEWDETLTSVGSHKPIQNRIQLNATRLESKINFANAFNLEKAFARKLLLVRVLIHEAVHVYSKMRTSGVELFRGKRGKNGTLTVTSGFEVQRHIIERGAIVRSEYDSSDLNEGMIDIMTDGIFAAYLQDEALYGLAETERFNEFFAKTSDTYKTQRESILDLTQVIAEETGVGFEMAYKGLMHQLFAEGALSKELEDWLSATIGKAAFAKMKSSSRKQ